MRQKEVAKDSVDLACATFQAHLGYGAMEPYFAWVGGWEWILILAVIVLLFGARKLPELARGLGRSIGEFKKGRLESDSPEVNESTSTQREESKS